VTYLQKVSNAYRDAMMESGVSEDNINFALFAFETGFTAGTLHNEDINLQKEMVKMILNKG
jgi:tape measure domain-containing protein